MLDTIDNSFIVAYIILVLIIGFIGSRKQTGDDFMIAGRKLGLFSFVSTLTASFIGGSTIVVYAAYVYEYGLGVLSAFLGLTLGFFLFSSLARTLRQVAKERNFHTISDFFQHCFDRKTGIYLAIFFFVVTSMLIINQFIAGTRILSAVSGYSYETSLYVSSAVVFLYLVLGGFRSVVKTDIFQYLLVLFLIAVIAFSMIGKSDFSSFELSDIIQSPGLVIFMFIYGFLVMWGSPDLWQRIYAAKNDDVVRKGTVISGLLMFGIGIFISLIAFSAKAAFPSIDPGEAMVYGLVHIMPQGLLGLGIVLLFAAIMSSADTLIFVLASIISKDFIYHKRKQPSSKSLMTDTRLAIIVIVALATLTAYLYRNIVHIAIIQAGLVLSIAPAIIASFKWKISASGLKNALLAGVLVVIYWIFKGQIEVQTMFSSVFASSIVLFFTEKYQRRKKLS